MAEKLGQPFMPWQRLVADVGCEINPATGLPAYREVRVTIPRQSGKTTLFLAWQINRCVSNRWPHPQRSVFTAQTGKDARDKWIDELFPLIRNSQLKRLVAVKGSRLEINEGMGNEVIRFRTGSLIRLLSTSTSSGHSKTLHQAVMDEVWHDTDDRREQGLRPAMITVPNAQLLVCSTAGTDASLVLNRKVETGRASVQADVGEGVAYFEWSAPDGWDPDDEASYFGFMPALCPDPPCRCAGSGESWQHTITLAALRAERDAMTDGEFRRAYGNLKTSNDAGEWQVIGKAAWQANEDPTSQLVGRPAYGVYVPPDRSTTAIAAAGDRAQGGRLIEITSNDRVGVDYRPGTGWVVERLKELDKHTPSVMVIDDKALAEAAEADGLVVHRATVADVVTGCQLLYDGVAGDHVETRDVYHLGQPELTDAVKGAVKRDVGGSWAWARRDLTVDVACAAAASLALAGHATPRIHRPADSPFFASWR